MTFSTSTCVHRNSLLVLCCIQKMNNDGNFHICQFCIFISAIVDPKCPFLIDIIISLMAPWLWKNSIRASAPCAGRGAPEVCCGPGQKIGTHRDSRNGHLSCGFLKKPCGLTSFVYSRSLLRAPILLRFGWFPPNFGLVVVVRCRWGKGHCALMLQTNRRARSVLFWVRKLAVSEISCIGVGDSISCEARE